MLAIRFSYCRVNGDGRIYDDFCKALERVNEPACFDVPENMSSVLLEIRHEMTEKDRAWEYMCRSLLERLYIDVFRLLSSDSVSASGFVSDDSKHSRYYRIEMWFADNFAKQITEDDLAAEVSISKRHLSRVLADIYGMSFREKLIEVRLHRAAQLLEQTEMNIDEIASAVGYKSFSGFHRAFVRYFGCTPYEYRKHNN
jgi:AraC-like DNA-binding protein